MRVRAKHWVKYDGEWHEAGETFNVSEQDAGMMSEYCEADTDEPEPTPEQTKLAVEEAPKRRGRPRKAE